VTLVALDLIIVLAYLYKSTLHSVYITYFTGKMRKNTKIIETKVQKNVSKHDKNAFAKVVTFANFNDGISSLKTNALTR